VVGLSLVRMIFRTPGADEPDPRKNIARSFPRICALNAGWLIAWYALIIANLSAEPSNLDFAMAGIPIYIVVMSLRNRQDLFKPHKRYRALSVLGKKQTQNELSRKRLFLWVPNSPIPEVMLFVAAAVQITVRVAQAESIH